MKKIKSTLFFVVIALILTSCTSKTPYTNRSQMILISQEEELALGERSYKQALNKADIIRGTFNSNRIKNIGYKIAQAANISNYKWEFNLVNNKAMNAFCLPGGKVVVYSGILKVAKNDDQLATVISHEIAHALARHGAERMSSAKVQQGIQLLGNIVLSSTAPQFTNIFNQAYGIGTQLGVMLPYGRLQENEADEIGIYLMAKAGYNPYEVLNFWKNMSAGKKQSNEFFSTHPSSNTRIKNIKRVISNITRNNQIKIKEKSNIKITNNFLGKKIY